MKRREALAGASTTVLGGITGCTEIQGMLFGKTPKKFKIENETASPQTVRIQIEADDQIILTESYEVPARRTIREQWPDADATTYTISASTADDEHAFTFDPADWKKRHTPLVFISQNGVEVFIN